MNASKGSKKLISVNNSSAIFFWVYCWLFHSFIGFKSIFKSLSLPPGLTRRVVVVSIDSAYSCVPNNIFGKMWVCLNLMTSIMKKSVRTKLVYSGCIYQRKSWAQDQALVTPLISPNPAPDHIADFHLFLNFVRSTIRGGVSVQQRVFFFAITWKKRIS